MRCGETEDGWETALGAVERTGQWPLTEKEIMIRERRMACARRFPSKRMVFFLEAQDVFSRSAGRFSLKRRAFYGEYEFGQFGGISIFVRTIGWLFAKAVWGEERVQKTKWLSWGVFYH